MSIDTVPPLRSAAAAAINSSAHDLLVGHDAAAQRERAAVAAVEQRVGALVLAQPSDLGAVGAPALAELADVDLALEPELDADLAAGASSPPRCSVRRRGRCRSRRPRRHPGAKPARSSKVRSSVSAAARSAVGPRSWAWNGTLITTSTATSPSEDAARACAAPAGGRGRSSTTPHAMLTWTNSDRAKIQRTWWLPSPVSVTVWIVSPATAGDQRGERDHRRHAGGPLVGSPQPHDEPTSTPTSSQRATARPRTRRAGPVSTSCGPSGPCVSGVDGTESSQPERAHHGGSAVTAATILTAGPAPTVRSPPPAFVASRRRLPSPAPKNCSISGWHHAIAITAMPASAVRGAGERSDPNGARTSPPRAAFRRTRCTTATSTTSDSAAAT